MSGTTSKLRILCFHGYRQNDVAFREKTGSLRKQFKKYAEFEFVCAPLRPNVDDAEEKNARGWWFSKSDSQFSSRDVTEIADGFDEAVDAVREYLHANGPFDGALGFSQGASVLHLLLAMEQKGQFTTNFKFAIFCSGFLSLSSMHDAYTNVIVNVPSLHIYGSGDEIVSSVASEKLMAMFPNSIAITHEGGHFVPSMTKYKDIFGGFLAKQITISA